MADVPAEWDIINLAFAEPTSATSGQLRFTLCPVAECPPGVETEAQFIAAIRAKQAAGKKVLISVGGANGQVQLASTAARDAFVSSAAAIIDRYGLDGIDIFEGHSLSLNANDTGFRSPTTPVIVNLIAALQSLKARYGTRFVLTMAPETFFVQLGYTNYGPGPFGGDPRAGAYLRVIHAAQRPHAAACPALQLRPHHGPGQPVPLHGQRRLHRDGRHGARRLPDPAEPGRRLPAAAARPGGHRPARRSPGRQRAHPGRGGAAGAHLPDPQHQRGGYTLRGGAKPALRGLMTWSINWDRFYGWEFSRSHEPFLNALP